MSANQPQLKYGVLALCGAAGVLAAMGLAAGSLSRQGAGLQLLWMLVFTAGFCGLMLRRPLFRQGEYTAVAAVGLLMSLCLRLCLFDYVSPDYVSFLGPWTAEMRTLTVPQALRTPIGDYNMPYLYILLVISRLKTYDLYCIKLVSVLADVLLALAAGYLTRLTARREETVLAAFLGTLLAPTVFLNSGYWGQCDGVYACFALWGLYFGLKKRPIPAMILFACSFAFKLQAIFILPVVAFLLVAAYIRPRHLPAFPLTFLAVMLPALLSGRSFSATFGIYRNQTAAYPYLSLNAPSFWSLVPNSYFSNLGAAAVVLAGTVTLLMLYVLLRRCETYGPGELITVAYLFALAIPWLLPRMHERYFYLAEVLSILYAAQHPRRLPVAAVQLTAGFLAYSSYLFGGMGILSNALVAAMLGVLLGYLICQFLRDTAPGGPAKTLHHHPSKEEHHHETGLPLE